LTVSNTLGLLTMVRAGLGLAVMPEFAGRLPGGEGLQFLPLMRPAVWREVCLITRRDRSPTPAARAFLDAILARLHAMSPLAGVKLAQ
jgi:DNA-binding transcriptional LysR family regulator